MEQNAISYRAIKRILAKQANVDERFARWLHREAACVARCNTRSTNWQVPSDFVIATPAKRLTQRRRHRRPGSGATASGGLRVVSSSMATYHRRARYDISAAGADRISLPLAMGRTNAFYALLPSIAIQEFALWCTSGHLMMLPGWSATIFRQCQRTFRRHDFSPAFLSETASSAQSRRRSYYCVASLPGPQLPGASLTR